MVGTGDSPFGQDFAGKRSEPALHAVADHRIADLPGDRKADALGRIAIGAVADQQDESGRGRAPTGVRSKKIRAFAEND